MYKGKAIYNPSGKAGEYSEWACNFYTGCSNGCTYCYLKSGRGASILGGDKPTLKKCFKDENHALEVFEKELVRNIDELQKHGLFFSFTTDPMLPDTIDLSYSAWGIALHMHDVPVKILTKRADWVHSYLSFMNESNSDNAAREWRKRLAFGFTLTGHDELEPNASPNAERIEAMKKLHDAGFRTFASIEPIISIDSSMHMIEQTLGVCDLYKIGLMSGQKVDKKYKSELTKFVGRVCMLAKKYDTKVYWKESIRNVMGGINSEASVDRDYNMFV